MNFEFYDSKKPWPESDTELCKQHKKTVVIHLKETECPLCTALAENEKLVQANIGADVRVARMESKMIDTEKYIKYLEEELEK